MAVNAQWKYSQEELDAMMPTLPPVRRKGTDGGGNWEPPAFGVDEASCASLANIMVAAEQGILSKEDMVVLPQHYARFKIEPIRFICENSLNFFQANIIKYILRSDAKNGLEDLRKAQRYLAMFIEFVQGNEWWWTKDFKEPDANVLHAVSSLPGASSGT